jgi:hypothetical protein
MNEIDYEYFWRKVVAWAEEQSVLRGRAVPFREIHRRWLAYIRP